MYAYLRYLALSLCLGLIAAWGSEVFFWSAPQADTDAPALILTVIVYSFCASCALSAVVLSGVPVGRRCSLAELCLASPLKAPSSPHV